VGIGCEWSGEEGRGWESVGVRESVCVCGCVCVQCDVIVRIFADLMLEGVGDRHTLSRARGAKAG
jgi:hypothetical protein